MDAKENQDKHEDEQKNANSVNGENQEEKIAETIVADSGSDSSDDDLEAQIAAETAADSMSSSEEDDDLEAQMAAAMETEGESSAGDDTDDLEAQMAAAMDEGTADDDELLKALSDEGVDTGTPVKPVKFQELSPSDEVTKKDNVDRLLDVGLNVSVELGRKNMQIKEILNLGPGKIIELDKLAGEPVDLLINGKLLAKGEVVVVDENFGVRITELINPVDRVKML